VMSSRPGRVANIHEVPFARPRSLEIMSTKEVFDLTNQIKKEIVGEQQSRYAKPSAATSMLAN
jgi:NitT/TauT family transport system ATP-binding protein